MEQVRWRRARPALAQELRTHLLDQRDACLAQGMSQTEAEAESLRQMGDPVEVGTQLDGVRRPARQWGMLALVGLLLCSGFFIQATVMQQLGRVQPYMPTVIVSILLGVAAMAVVYLGDYTLLGRRPVLLYGLGMTGLVLLTVTSEVKAQGVKLDAISYLLLGPVLYALLVYGLRGKGWRGLLLALAGLVPPVVLPCLIPNFTSGAIAVEGLDGGAPEEGGSRRGRWAPGIERGRAVASVSKPLCVGAGPIRPPPGAGPPGAGIFPHDGPGDALRRPMAGERGAGGTERSGWLSPWRFGLLAGPGDPRAGLGRWAGPSGPDDCPLRTGAAALYAAEGDAGTPAVHRGPDDSGPGDSVLCGL